MKIYLLLQYYLNLNIKKLGKSPQARSNSSTRSLIQKDTDSRLGDLIATCTNYQNDYSYRVVISKLSKTLWHSQIRVKSNNLNSTKINLVYKLKNKFLYTTLIK